MEVRVRDQDYDKDNAYIVDDLPRNEQATRYSAKLVAGSSCLLVPR